MPDRSAPDCCVSDSQSSTDPSPILPVLRTGPGCATAGRLASDPIRGGSPGLRGRRRRARSGGRSAVVLVGRPPRRCPTRLGHTGCRGRPGRPGPAAPPGITTSTGQAVTVHVAGAVTRPGLLHLPGGSRVADALVAAGGSLPRADLDRLNLAARLSDGQKVWVTRRGESVVPGSAGPGAVGGGGGAGNPGPAGSAEPIDLNTADLAALDSLPGIGPSHRPGHSRRADPARRLPVHEGPPAGARHRGNTFRPAERSGAGVTLTRTDGPVAEEGATRGRPCPLRAESGAVLAAAAVVFGTRAGEHLPWAPRRADRSPRRTFDSDRVRRPVVSPVGAGRPPGSCAWRHSGPSRWPGPWRASRGFRPGWRPARPRPGRRSGWRPIRRAGGPASGCRRGWRPSGTAGPAGLCSWWRSARRRSACNCWKRGSRRTSSDTSGNSKRGSGGGGGVTWPPCSRPTTSWERGRRSRAPSGRRTVSGTGCWPAGTGWARPIGRWWPASSSVTTAACRPRWPPTSGRPGYRISSSCPAPT